MESGGNEDNEKANDKNDVMSKKNKAAVGNLKGMELTIDDQPSQLESMESSSDIQCQEGVVKSKRRRRRQRHSFQSTNHTEHGGSSSGSESPPFLESDSPAPGAYHEGGTFMGRFAASPMQAGGGGGQPDGPLYHGEHSNGDLIEEANRPSQGGMGSGGTQLPMDTDLNSLVPADSTPAILHPHNEYVLSVVTSPIDVVHAQLVVERDESIEERLAAEIEARLQAEFRAAEIEARLQAEFRGQVEQEVNRTLGAIVTAEVVVSTNQNIYGNNPGGDGNDTLPSNNNRNHHPSTTTEIVGIEGEEGLEGRDVASKAKVFSWRICIMTALLLGVVAIGIFFGMHSSESVSPKTFPTISPSTELTPVTPTSSSELTQRYNDMRQVLLNISSEEDLDDESSPQFRAMEWIVSMDGLQLDPSSSYDLYQRYIVVVLYFATKGETWSYGYNFLTNVSICNWNGRKQGFDPGGLFCHDSTEDLEIVSLGSNGLKGRPLPPEIGWLSSLARFDVGDNAISGAIPPTISALTNLLYLNLEWNQFTGSLPALGALRNLAHLELAGNFLIGSLHSDLQELHELVWLDASYNILTGSIPSLNGLDLYAIILKLNQLSGSLSGLLGDFNGYSLPSLRILDLSNNKISGTLPTIICNLISLEKLKLNLNEMEGQLPSCLGSLLYLESISLSNNNFTGFVEFVCPSSVEQIVTDYCSADPCPCCFCTDMEDTQTLLPSSFPTTSVPPTSSPTLTVPPTSVSDDSSLTYSAIREVLLKVTNSTVLDDPSSPQNKAMVWLIDEDLRQVPATNEDVLIQRYIIAVIYFAMNGPQWTDNLDFLSERSVCQWNSRDNYGYLKGCVCLGDGKDVVRSIDLGSNNLGSSIPPELGYLSSVEYIYFYVSSMTGMIPTELGLLTNLSYLEMSDVGLTGPLPSELGSLTHLTFLSLPINRLTGTLPSELGNLHALTALWLAKNKFEGIIPSSLGNLTNLENIFIQGNDFSRQDLDPILCPLNKTYLGFWADCISELACTCCSVCCDRSICDDY